MRRRKLTDFPAFLSDDDDTIRQSLPHGGRALPAGVFEFTGTGQKPRSAATAKRGASEDLLFSPGQSGKQADFASDFDFGSFSSLPRESRSRNDAGIDKAFDLAAINPLVAAASPLLWLAGRLAESAQPDNIAEFRHRVIDEIRHFETAAMTKNVPDQLVRVTRYALCATIDDIILNTSWGAASGWASGSLVSVLYNETWGGERFFDLLSNLLHQPENAIDAIELMAICLAIGFCGKYRVMEGGLAQLTRLRHDVYRTIRRVRGPYEKNMSATWVGISAPYKPPPSLSAPWIAGGLILALLIALWAFSSISLRGRVETAAEHIRALVPTIPVVVERAGIPVIPEPAPPVRLTQVERISAALKDEIATNRIEVARTGERIVIRMLGASFPSAGTELAKTEEPILAAIGAALDSEPGAVLVTGHTDNIPVGPGSRLGDNFAISAARAKSAADMLKRHLGDAGRVTFEGRGQNDPIATNDTAEGRARNRRVEVSIPAERSP